MKRKHLSLLFAALCFCHQPYSLQAGELDKWLEGSEMSKPCTWWHWLDCNVTKSGITADLEAMQRAGYHEAQIFNGAMGFPEGEAKYLSEYWLDCMKWAAQEAQRLGMTLCFHNSPGWSSSGGKWMTVENSMQRVTWSETTLESNGKETKIQLPEPKKVRNYYEDIIVLAFPTPTSEARIPLFQLKSLGTNSAPSQVLPSDPRLPQEAIVSKENVQDISAYMSADGTLTWKAPKGKWTILRMGHTTTGKESHPTSPATGGGLECDKLSRKAMDAYWEGGVQPVLDYLGPLAGTVLNNALIDSYEVGCGNWTDGFLKEFQQRRNYDALPYLPILAGYAVQGGLESERFLWDWRKTVGQLMAENYFGYFGELCHKHGLMFSTEPYSGPFDDLEVGSTADIVMGEFWVGMGNMMSSTKIASSIAHMRGSAIVGAEAFTAPDNLAGWDGSPARIKVLCDHAWCEGITHFIYHTFAHQPYDIGPGFSLGGYGSQMNRLSTVWEPAKAFQEYVKRSQYLLQQGRFVGDILLYNGETSPNDGTYRVDIPEMGLDYDEISTATLAALRVKNGKIVTSSGGEYRLLVLPKGEYMTPQTLAIIERLANEGAAIIGPRPSASPSLEGYPQCDEEVRHLATRLWDKGLIKDEGIATAVKRIGISPDFSTPQGLMGLSYIHRTSPEGEIYFVTNKLNQHVRPLCTFRVDGMTPERWDTEKGTKEQLAWTSMNQGNTTLFLDLEPEQSCFVIFRPSSEKGIGIVQQNQTLVGNSVQALPQLEIKNAHYGHFLPLGVADVTDKVVSLLKDSTLHFAGSNNLFGDPCFGKVKSMKVFFIRNGKEESVQGPENYTIHETSIERVTRAFYGDVSPEMNDPRPQKGIDVKDIIQGKLDKGTFCIPVDDSLVPQNALPKDNLSRSLRIEYSLGDKNIQNIDIPTGAFVDFTDFGTAPKLSINNGQLQWTTAQEGEICLETTEGKKLTAKAKNIPESIELNENWDVLFIDPYKKEFSAQMPTLASLSENQDEKIRYFSGTAVYRKQVDIPAKLLQKDICLKLDLGMVGVIAEVVVNGTPADTLWKAPFSMEIGPLLHKGKNELEIRVTNTWRNRLIGDEHYPQDVPMRGSTPAKFPDWLKGKGERQSQRSTFCTYQHWNAQSPLQEAGLIGPVVLKPYKRIILK